jgi:DNA-binding PadR family transcriptional regulator
MEDRAATAGWSVDPVSRFELSPPRRFLLPTVLLLLAEEPGYGYSLTKGLRELRFGRVDRPSVYRALAQLERDGLVESSDEPGIGQARRVYWLTEHGERALRAWMGVIKEERDCLDRVLRRYMATGTIDAILAEVEGGWAAVTGSAQSPMSSTSEVEGVRVHGAVTPAVPAPAPEPLPAAADTASPAAVERFTVVPERSVVLIEARSTVGPITFGAIGVTGTIEVKVCDGVVCADHPPVAHLEVEVDKLRSGNGLYDAELLRRIDARRYPIVTLDLEDCVPVGVAKRYRLSGDVTFHGARRRLHGTVTVAQASEHKLVVRGTQVFDIRDFDIALPTVLMLRIYPDVSVQLQVEAESEGS